MNLEITKTKDYIQKFIIKFVFNGFVVITLRNNHMFLVLIWLGLP